MDNFVHMVTKESLTHNRHTHIQMYHIIITYRQEKLEHGSHVGEMK